MHRGMETTAVGSLCLVDIGSAILAVRRRDTAERPHLARYSTAGWLFPDGKVQRELSGIASAA